MHFKDEVPASMMDAHLKNVEKTCVGGKFDPTAGLTTSGIAGTGTDKEKEEEEVKSEQTPSESDAKDATKKESKIFFFYFFYEILIHLY